MITVYGGGPSRSFRVVWALEEMAIPYRLQPVDLRRRMDDEALIRLNPAGFLPVLEDGEAVMVESVAMLEYLMARYGGGALAPAVDDPAYPTYQQFLHLGEGGMAAYLNVVVGSRFGPEAERQNFGVKVAIGMFLNRLQLVSRRLAEAPMMAGEAFTAADISVVYALDMADRLGLADRFGSEVTAYRARMAARPAYQAAAALHAPLFRSA